MMRPGGKMTMGWQGLAHGASSSKALTGPRVLASMPIGLRATLLERGHWGAVRAVLEHRDLDAAVLLEGVRRSEWLGLSAHIALVEAAAEVLGLDGLRALGALRTQESTMGGLFPNLLRSWVRSFRSDPASLLRIGPQIWQAAFRDAGEFVIDEVRPFGASVRIIDCEAMATSIAWQHIIEGSGAGIMQLAGLALYDLKFVSDGARTTRGELRWRAADS